MSTTATLVRRLDSFLRSALEATRGYLAAAPANGRESAEHLHRIAGVAETSPTFERLVQHVASTLSRYESRDDDAIHTKKGSLRLRNPAAEARGEVASFLRRAETYKTLAEGRQPQARGLADALLADAAKLRVNVRHLIPIDGLYLPEGTDIDLGAARLRRLDKDDWDSFFEAGLYQAPQTADLACFGVLELIETDQERPSGGMRVFFGPPEARVAKLAEPWITYVCLFKGKTVEPCALYSKPDTRLMEPPVQSLQLHPPSFEERYFDDDGSTDWAPIYELDVDAPQLLRDFMLEIHRHRAAADTHGPRVSTALHWYRRASRKYFDATHSSFFLGRDVHEDSLTDAFTALEAVLLQRGERGKGPKIAARVAGLLSTTDQEFCDIEAAVGKAYALRNDLVHGDARPEFSIVTESASFLRDAARKALIVALRLDGDQAPLVAGATNVSLRPQNRRLLEDL